MKHDDELHRSADGMEVTDDASYNTALAYIERGKRLLDAIGALRDPVIKAAYETHKAAPAAKSKLAGRIDAIVAALRRKTVAYYEAERRRTDAERREAEDRAREEAEARRLIYGPPRRPEARNRNAQAACSTGKTGRPGLSTSRRRSKPSRRELCP
jgi:hypothetical protein